MGCGSSKNTTNKLGDKTAMERKQMWATVQQRIPRAKTVEDKQRRIDLFKEFDEDQTGAITLDEAYSGCVNILHLDEFTNRLRDIVKPAFNSAKDLGTRADGAGDDDKVEFPEFRMMLCYIYDYFELMVMFDEIDTSGNMLIDEDEFKKAVPKIEEWGVEMKDPAAVFKTLDDNGSGTVTFDEFAKWATVMKLKADGDPDNGLGEEDPAYAAQQAAAAAALQAAAAQQAAAQAAPVQQSRDIDLTGRQVSDDRNAADRKAAWEKIRLELPRQKTPEDKQRRIELFKQYDVNNSRALSLSEVYNGAVNVSHLDEFTSRLYDIITRAFNKAKDLGTKDRGEGEEDKVEFLEFRLMLCYIYDYFELTVMFDEIDADGSMTVDRNEFKAAVPKIAEWGVNISDPDRTFDLIDGNNSGIITFDEFASWASAMKLEADKDE